MENSSNPHLTGVKPVSVVQQVPENASATGAICRLWSRLNLGCGTALGLANPFEFHLTGRPLNSGLLSVFTAM